MVVTSYIKWKAFQGYGTKSVSSRQRQSEIPLKHLTAEMFSPSALHAQNCNLQLPLRCRTCTRVMSEASVEIVPGAGHLLILERPEFVNQGLLGIPGGSIAGSTRNRDLGSIL